MADGREPEVCDANMMRTLICSLADDHIDLKNLALRWDALETLCQALPENPNIRRLTLDNTGVGDESLNILVPAIALAASLETLSLCSNSISDHGLAKLFALSSHPSLSTLSLRHTPISCGSNSRLSDYLATDPALSELDLSHTLIANEGATLIAGSLHSNTHLRTLNLTSTKIGAKGSILLMEWQKARPYIDIRGIHVFGADFLRPLLEATHSANRPGTGRA